MMSTTGFKHVKHHQTPLDVSVDVLVTDAIRIAGATPLPPPPWVASLKKPRERPSETRHREYDSHVFPTPEWGININLSSSYMGVAQAGRIARLMVSNQTITTLDLSMCDLYSEGCEYLVRCLKRNCVLKHLSLNGNRIGPRGAVALAEYLAYDATVDRRKQNGVPICAPVTVAPLGFDGCEEIAPTYIPPHQGFNSTAGLQGSSASASQSPASSHIGISALRSSTHNPPNASALLSPLSPSSPLRFHSNNNNTSTNNASVTTNTTLLSSTMIGGGDGGSGIGDVVMGPDGVPIEWSTRVPPPAPVLRGLYKKLGEYAVDDDRTIAPPDYGRCPLVSLSLSHNAIGDEGAVAITNALRINKSLTFINLRANNLTNLGGFAILDALADHYTLEEDVRIKNERDREAARQAKGKKSKRTSTVPSSSPRKSVKGELPSSAAGVPTSCLPRHLRFDLDNLSAEDELRERLAARKRRLESDPQRASPTQQAPSDASPPSLLPDLVPTPLLFQGLFTLLTLPSPLTLSTAAKGALQGEAGSADVRGISPDAKKKGGDATNTSAAKKETFGAIVQSFVHQKKPSKLQSNEETKLSTGTTATTPAADHGGGSQSPRDDTDKRVGIEEIANTLAAVRFKRRWLSLMTPEQRYEFLAFNFPSLFPQQCSAAATVYSAEGTGAGCGGIPSYRYEANPILSEAARVLFNGNSTLNISLLGEEGRERNASSAISLPSTAAFAPPPAIIEKSATPRRPRPPRDTANSQPAVGVPSGAGATFHERRHAAPSGIENGGGYFYPTVVRCLGREASLNSPALSASPEEIVYFVGPTVSSVPPSLVTPKGSLSSSREVDASFIGTSEEGTSGGHQGPQPYTIAFSERSNALRPAPLFEAAATVITASAIQFLQSCLVKAMGQNVAITVATAALYPHAATLLIGGSGAESNKKSLGEVITEECGGLSVFSSEPSDVKLAAREGVISEQRAQAVRSAADDYHGTSPYVAIFGRRARAVGEIKAPPPPQPSTPRAGRTRTITALDPLSMSATDGTASKRDSIEAASDAFYRYSDRLPIAERTKVSPSNALPSALAPSPQTKGSTVVMPSPRSLSGHTRGGVAGKELGEVREYRRLRGLSGGAERRLSEASGSRSLSRERESSSALFHSKLAPGNHRQSPSPHDAYSEGANAAISAAMTPQPMHLNLTSVVAVSFDADTMPFPTTTSSSAQRPLQQEDLFPAHSSGASTGVAPLTTFPSTSSGGINSAVLGSPTLSTPPPPSAPSQLKTYTSAYRSRGLEEVESIVPAQLARRSPADVFADVTSPAATVELRRALLPPELVFLEVMGYFGGSIDIVRMLSSFEVQREHEQAFGIRDTDADMGGWRVVHDPHGLGGPLVSGAGTGDGGGSYFSSLSPSASNGLNASDTHVTRLPPYGHLSVPTFCFSPGANFPSYKHLMEYRSPAMSPVLGGSDTDEDDEGSGKKRKDATEVILSGGLFGSGVASHRPLTSSALSLGLLGDKIQTLVNAYMHLGSSPTSSAMSFAANYMQGTSLSSLAASAGAESELIDKSDAMARRAYDSWTNEASALTAAVDATHLALQSVAMSARQGGFAAGAGRARLKQGSMVPSPPPTTSAIERRSNASKIPELTSMNMNMSTGGGGGGGGMMSIGPSLSSSPRAHSYQNVSPSAVNSPSLSTGYRSMRPLPKGVAAAVNASLVAKGPHLPPRLPLPKVSLRDVADAARASLFGSKEVASEVLAWCGGRRDIRAEATAPDIKGLAALSVVPVGSRRNWLSVHSVSKAPSPSGGDRAVYLKGTHEDSFYPRYAVRVPFPVEATPFLPLATTIVDLMRSPMYALIDPLTAFLRGRERMKSMVNNSGQAEGALWRSSVHVSLAALNTPAAVAAALALANVNDKSVAERQQSVAGIGSAVSAVGRASAVSGGLNQPNVHVQPTAGSAGARSSRPTLGGSQQTASGVFHHQSRSLSTAGGGGGNGAMSLAFNEDISNAQSRASFEAPGGSHGETLLSPQQATLLQAAADAHGGGERAKGISLAASKAGPSMLIGAQKELIRIVNESVYIDHKKPPVDVASSSPSIQNGGVVSLSRATYATLFGTSGPASTSEGTAAAAAFPNPPTLANVLEVAQWEVAQSMLEASKAGGEKGNEFIQHDKWRHGGDETLFDDHQALENSRPIVEVVRNSGPLSSVWFEGNDIDPLLSRAIVMALQLRYKPNTPEGFNRKVLRTVLVQREEEERRKLVAR